MKGEHEGWDRYLREVYGGGVSYPVDLRSFSWFYSIAELPLMQSRGVQPLRLGPLDPPQYGHAWVGRCERAHLGVCDPESFGGGGGDTGGAGVPPGFFVQQYHVDQRAAGGQAHSSGGDNEARRGREAAAHPSESAYVEVVRVGAAHIDELRGIWYWMAKGSGIWLELGASLDVDSPAAYAIFFLTTL